MKNKIKFNSDGTPKKGAILTVNEILELSPAKDEIRRYLSHLKIGGMWLWPDANCCFKNIDNKTFEVV